MRNAIACLCLCLSSCGGADNDGPITCEQTERAGTYWMTAEQVSGDCGPLTDGLVRPDAELTADCEPMAADAWSGDGCTVERAFRCQLETGSLGTFVTVTTQRSDSGSVITGTMTMLVEATDGSSCASSYRLRYERQ